MKVTEAAFVGFPVSDVNRARDFYGEVLGLKPGGVDHEIGGMPGKYWIEYDLGNVTLAISNAWEPSGQSGPTLALEVDDFDAAVAALRAANATFILERMETPMCCFALITDPDGNSITIHKRNAGCSH